MLTGCQCVCGPNAHFALQVMSQQTPLQPKSPLLGAGGATLSQMGAQQQVATAQVLSPSQFKQLSQNNPQLISSQPPTVISQAQLLGERAPFGPLGRPLGTFACLLPEVFPPLELTKPRALA